MDVKVPDIGDFTDVPVISILVSVGDTVAEEDPLIELESDKATMEVPSPAAGTVKEINLNFTELASIGNFQIIIPNSEVWGNTIVNYSAYPMRRAEWTFGVGYGADLAKAERVIRDTILGDPRTDQSEDLFLQVNGLGASSVDFLCRAWVSADDFFAYQADMKRRVKEALDAAGIEIPFQTRTLHITRDEAAPDHGRSQRSSEDEVRQDQAVTG